MAGVIVGPLATYLEDHRDVSNAAVALARRAHPRFDPSLFGAALADVAAPVLEHVMMSPAHIGGTSDRADIDRLCGALFDVSLQLVAGTGLSAEVNQAWSALLPALAPVVLVDPRRALTLITNAADTLARTPGARPEQWCALVAASAPHLRSLVELERVGQVAAWRSGMAAYRDGALAIAATLSVPQLAAVLQVETAGLERLRLDPWYLPQMNGSSLGPGTPSKSQSPASPTDVVRVGTFRGLGGAFQRPPVVALDDRGRLVASDGEERWFVMADAFGSAVVRAGGNPKLTRPPKRSRPAAVHRRIPELTSWARTPGAWAVTSSLSHAVLFVGDGP